MQRCPIGLSAFNLAYQPYFGGYPRQTTGTITYGLHECTQTTVCIGTRVARQSKQYVLDDSTRSGEGIPLEGGGGLDVESRESPPASERSKPPSRNVTVETKL